MWRDSQCKHKPLAALRGEDTSTDIIWRDKEMHTKCKGCYHNLGGLCLNPSVSTLQFPLISLTRCTLTAGANAIRAASSRTKTAPRTNCALCAQTSLCERLDPERPNSVPLSRLHRLQVWERRGQLQRPPRRLTLQNTPRQGSKGLNIPTG